MVICLDCEFCFPNPFYDPWWGTNDEMIAYAKECPTPDDFDLEEEIDCSAFKLASNFYRLLARKTKQLAKEVAQAAKGFWQRQGFFGHILKKELNWNTFERIELQKRRDWLFPEGYDIHEGRSKP